MSHLQGIGGPEGHDVCAVDERKVLPHERQLHDRPVFSQQTGACKDSSERRLQYRLFNERQATSTIQSNARHVQRSHPEKQVSECK